MCVTKLYLMQSGGDTEYAFSQDQIDKINFVHFIQQEVRLLLFYIYNPSLIKKNSIISHFPN